MDKIKLKNIVEAILVASDRILSLSQIEKMLTEKKTVPVKTESESHAANDAVIDKKPETVEEVTDENAETSSEDTLSESESAEPTSLKRSIKEVLEILQNDYAGRALELKEVASGYRFQVRQDYAEHVGKLWEEKPSKYSRALLETLVLIAYRQPITRGEIEAIRGVSVSSHIVKTLTERDWVRVIGHRDVPGKPAIYGSTRGFLDYFNLKSLDELPSLADIKDLDKIAPELALNEKVEELEAALKENNTEHANTPNTSDDKRKIQIRQMRRLRRSKQSGKGIDKNADIDNEGATASQEIESSEAEIS